MAERELVRVKAARPGAVASRSPDGYRTRRDVVISTLGGTLRVEANKMVRSESVIGHLQRAGIQLDPFWD